MSDLMLDVDQAGELKAAFRRGDWTNQEIKKLCEGDVLASVRNVIRGYASIMVLEHVIDCDVTPFVPSGWKVEEHQKGGALRWDKERQKDALFLAIAQKSGRIEGNKLRKELELAKEPVLNANVLDYLLANPHLIPEEWKGKYVFFWGTIYRASIGGLCVRCLHWHGDEWYWNCLWLGNDWHDDYPAALRAS